jgi:TetR/AcrR family transcriptional regulator
VDKAKVNKRMVYHYFGDKEGLYREVHLRGWGELQKGFQKSLETFNWGQVHESQAEQALVVRAMDFLFDFAVEHLIFLRIILWDALEGGKVTRSLWSDSRAPLYQEISMLLMAAQQQGLIPPEFKINHLIATSLGMLSFYFTFANSLQEVFPPDPMDPTALAERKQQMLLSFKRMIGIKD